MRVTGVCRPGCGLGQPPEAVGEVRALETFTRPHDEAAGHRDAARRFRRRRAGAGRTGSSSNARTGE